MSNVVSALGNMFGKLFSPTPDLKVDTPAMPDPNSAASKLAAQKKVAARTQTGRSGTIYSGGGSYSGANLGGTSNT